MSAGFIVIPIGDANVDDQELRELAASLQQRMHERIGIPGLLPLASHFLDHPSVVAYVARRLQSAGHSFPDCEACP